MKFRDCLFLIFLVGCGAGGDSPDKAERRGQEGVSTQNPVYRFPNDAGDAVACSTGQRRFENLGALCLGLQNDELNNHCALDTRIAHFSQWCEPVGYRFLESAKCELLFARAGVRVTLLAPPKPEDTTRRVELCAGRKAMDPETYASPVTVAGGGLHASLDALREGNGRMALQYQVEDSGVLRLETSRGGRRVLRLKTGETLFLECQMTWGCP